MIPRVAKLRAEELLLGLDVERLSRQSLRDAAAPYNMILYSLI